MADNKTIDQNLYSRQLGAFGLEAQGKLIKMKIFLHGLRGLGVETAKNLILAGPNTVILHDDGVVEARDLGSNFYLGEEDVGKKTRAEASLEQLKDLNMYVNVAVHAGDITVEYLANFDVVVFTDYYDIDKLVEFNDFCRSREKSIGFIYAGNLGLYGFTFVDFGVGFKVFDKTGEEVKSSIIVNITQEEKSVVTVHEDKKHKFVSGDFISFSEVEGMTEVNGKNFEVTYLSPYSFSIGDTSKFSPYKREGVATQVKVPQELKFKKLSDALFFPLGDGKYEIDTADFSKDPNLLHLTLLAIFEFVKKHKDLPRLNNAADAQELLSLTNELNDNNKKKMDIEGLIKVENINEEVVKNIASFARAQISSTVSFWGGIVAQEIVKYTGKFTPLNQWLHYESFETLPDTPVNRETSNCRYDDLIAIYGRETQQLLHNQKIFMVGAGALGCEFVKMLALMGVSCQSPGLLTVTDDDNIELSNLNRQFLFRKPDVGKSKAERALAAGSRMNKHLRNQAYKLRVGAENEVIFNDNFWENLDFVINAVDNVHARLYVDSRCVFYYKPLLESGTLGTKCNSQIILPGLTQSYSETSDPPEESIPLCTLKNFPHQIEHTIQWARDYFEGNFVEGPVQLKKYLENPDNYLKHSLQELKDKPSVLRQRLETVEKLRNAFEQKNFEVCVWLARLMYEDVFHNMIASLLYSFPLDHKTEQGQLFWSGPKRPPQVLDFSVDEPVSLEFVHSAANIFAYSFGLDYCLDKEKIKEICKKINVPKFELKKISLPEVEKKDGTAAPAAPLEEDEDVIKELVKKLEGYKSEEVHKRIRLTEFEKDDDSNFHIDVIAAIANLRARNYKIAEADRLKIKLIAGKIIPAIATTTAMIVGAVGTELIKLVLKKKVDLFKNAFMNLALPLFILTDPLPPNKNCDKEYDPILLGPIRAIPPNFTVWDKITVNGPLTLEEFFKHMGDKFKVTISLVSSGRVCLYNKYSNDASMKQRAKMEIKALLEKIEDKPFPSHKKYLELEISGETLEDMVDCVMPTIKYMVS